MVAPFKTSSGVWSRVKKSLQTPPPEIKSFAERVVPLNQAGGVVAGGGWGSKLKTITPNFSLIQSICTRAVPFKSRKGDACVCGGHD